MFDQPPSIGEIVIAGWQRPHAVQVIRQDYPGVDMEWPLDPNLPHHGSKHVDMPDEPIIRVTFEQIDGEEIGSAGYAVNSVKLSRHSGRDCRNPEHREVTRLCHPWLLDPGIPCRGDVIRLNLTALGTR